MLKDFVRAGILGGVEIVNKCVDIADKVLRRTSHVLRAKDVAYFVGFCTFAGRIFTLIGFRGSLAATIPGKGLRVNQVLSLAFPKVYYELIARPEMQQDSGKVTETIRKCVDEAVKELNENRIWGYETENWRQQAEGILYKCCQWLPSILKRLGIADRAEELKVYTELSVVDYELHVHGVIDAVVEDPKTKKAITIVWKTTGKTSSHFDWDDALAYIYAMLEAERLGYSRNDPTREGNIVEAIASKDAETNPNSVKIVPLLISPDIAESYSPAFKIGRVIRTKDVRLMIYKILLAVDHLVFLATDHVAVSGYSRATLDKCVCKVVTRRGEEYERRVFDVTPSGVRVLDPDFGELKIEYPRGRPYTQQGFPCNVCKKLFPGLSDACRFYYGGEETQLRQDERLRIADKLMWSLRFIVRKIHERNLLPLRALYTISREYSPIKLIETLEKGGRTVYVYDRCESSLIIEERARGLYYNMLTISVEDRAVRIGLRGVDYRIDVFEEWEVENFEIVLRRRLREHELRAARRGKIEVEIPVLRTPSRSVLLLLLEDNVQTLTHCVKLFGRVSSLDLLRESEDVYVLELRVSPISPALRLPFVLLKRLREKCNFTKVVAVEVSADLTTIELYALDYIHRSVLRFARELNEKELENSTRKRHKILRQHLYPLLFGALGEVSKKR